ncbi:MAG: N-acetylmuramoyl-L-alanine amidase [Ulvibacter sp.]|jgi:N-acetylmuramoyl-L-alanine amidase
MKNLLGVLLVLSIFCTLAFTTQSSYKEKTTTIIIDVSHGGADSGATFDRISEKEIVLEISQLIKEKNINKNIKIEFTREDDDAIGLQERVAFINQLKPDLVLSLHIASNAERSVSGIEIFVAEECTAYEKSYILAKKLKNKFDSKITDLDARIKKANFFLMKRSNHPILTVELGFITNENDRLCLQDPFNQAAMAQTILEFISEI